MNVWCRIALVLCAAALAGCVTAGREIKPAQVEQIQQGRTTRAEVEELLGPPQREDDSEGKHSLIYSCTKTSPQPQDILPILAILFGAVDVKTDTLTISLDQNDVVQDFERNQESSVGRFGLLLPLVAPKPTSTETDEPTPESPTPTP